MAPVRGVGVDTVGVAFPSTGFRLPNVAGRQSLPSGGFVATGVPGFAWVEASLPKRVSGQNIEALPVSEVQRVVGEMVVEACRFVAPDAPVRTLGEGDREIVTSVEDPRIVRLDLVRDFRLRDPDSLTSILTGLADIPRRGRVKVRRFNDARSGRAETLRVGPGSWAATLYDKAAETKGLAPRGSLRAEFRLRGRQLLSQRMRSNLSSIATLSDVTESKAELARRFWFDQVHFGSWVGGRTDIWRGLRKIGLSDREMLYFVGWMQRS